LIPTVTCLVAVTLAVTCFCGFHRKHLSFSGHASTCVAGDTPSEGNHSTNAVALAQVVNKRNGLGICFLEVHQELPFGMTGA